MSDLISRQKVMEMLTKIELSCTQIPITEAKLGLRDIPIAYDVDEVVEQLQEISKVYCEEYHQREGSLYLQDAIEIMKAGGIHE